MQWQDKLSQLSNVFRVGLDKGVTIQYLVDSHSVEILTLLRTHKNKGPLSLKSLSQALGINPNSLKTCLSRKTKVSSDLPKPISTQTFMSKKILTNAEQPLLERRASEDSERIERCIYFKGEPINSIEINWVLSKQNFHLNYKNKIFEMFYKSEKSGLMFFNAKPFENEVLISQIIKFDIKHQVFK
ncbi:hypothetical protein [Thiomicrorhabdus sp. Milos-T2]|uniref:hypothetical protein n=1 Tax=Thiomicrorhabdus sp. Milos-T2 TaxID=90814 RepID=UPI000493E427|nr:hypothetical protein [Thiomicrorhabdus sp. Milos-T2]